jgi:hypothetical protein
LQKPARGSNSALGRLFLLVYFGKSVFLMDQKHGKSVILRGQKYGKSVILGGQKHGKSVKSDE